MVAEDSCHSYARCNAAQNPAYRPARYFFSSIDDLNWAELSQFLRGLIQVAVLAVNCEAVIPLP